MKICNVCGEEKPHTEYAKRKDRPCGILSKCKSCAVKIRRKYSKTKNGLIYGIFANQKQNSLRRGHPQPTYSKRELHDWLFSQKLFHKLYDNWKRLDFQKDYIPSVDRIDDYIGYTISNISLTTWSKNRERSFKDRSNNKNNKCNRAVIQTTIDGKCIGEYFSIAEASRKTGCRSSGIHNTCSGGQKKCGGYRWKFH